MGWAIVINNNNIMGPWYYYYLLLWPIPLLHCYLGYLPWYPILPPPRYITLLQQSEVKKKPSWVKTSTYHHPHHPARQPSKWKPSCHMTDCEERRSTQCTSTQKSCHGQLPSQASEAPAGSRVHLSLGWLDARAWYQWTTLLSRSYYLCSSHVSGTKHA